MGLPPKLTAGLRDLGRRHPVAMVGASFLVGAIPFSNIAAHLVAGRDLRTVGSGTVSGTSLHREAGFGPLALAGVCEVAKGSVGPALTRDRPAVSAAAAGAAVAGHNWSPFIGFAGGRGISPAMGGLAVRGWEGTATLTAGLALGRMVGQTALVSLIAQVALVPVLGLRRGRPGLSVAAAVLVPLILKRVMGNALPAPPRPLRLWVSRLLFDRDPPG